MIDPNRTCVDCGLNKIYLEKGKYAHWRRKNDQWYCQKCFNRLFTPPERIKRLNTKWNPIRNARSIRYKKRRVNVGFNPRTGVCSLCRKQGLTHIHHMKYNDENPLKDTIEICPRCHKYERVN